MGVVINSVAPAVEKIVVDADVGGRAPVVVDHDRGRLVVRIDDRVVADGYIRNAAIDLNAIIMRRAGREQIVNIVVLNRRRAGDVDAVLDIVDIVANERPLTIDPARTVVAAADTVDLAILDNRSRYALRDLDDAEACRRDLAVDQRDVRGIYIDGPADVEPGDDCSGLGDNNVSRRSQRYARRNAGICRVRPSSCRSRCSQGISP